MFAPLLSLGQTCSSSSGSPLSSLPLATRVSARSPAPAPLDRGRFRSTGWASVCRMPARSLDRHGGDVVHHGRGRISVACCAAGVRLRWYRSRGSRNLAGEPGAARLGRLSFARPPSSLRVAHSACLQGRLAVTDVCFAPALPPSPHRSSAPSSYRPLCPLFPSWAHLQRQKSRLRRPRITSRTTRVTTAKTSCLNWECTSTAGLQSEGPRSCATRQLPMRYATASKQHNCVSRRSCRFVLSSLRCGRVGGIGGEGGRRGPRGHERRCCRYGNFV